MVVDRERMMRLYASSVVVNRSDIALIHQHNLNMKNFGAASLAMVNSGYRVCPIYLNQTLYSECLKTGNASSTYVKLDIW